MPEVTADSVRGELKSWLADAWDPDLTVSEWWARLADSGWAVPTWPSEWLGRDLPREFAGIVTEELRAAGAVGPPAGLGMLLAGPTILTHGNDEQKARYLRPIVSGEEGWCQLFSEPGAGSDLASLQTKAERDGEEWLINGQKVWTSGGQVADLGMLLARTDPDAPKHTGISYFAVPMDQPGVDVRPLRDDRSSAVQRGLLRQRTCRRRRDHRRTQRGLDRREHDARERARRPRQRGERRRRSCVSRQEGRHAPGARAISPSEPGVAASSLRTSVARSICCALLPTSSVARTIRSFANAWPSCTSSTRSGASRACG